jgi:hypothetical protein
MVVGKSVLDARDLVSCWRKGLFMKSQFLASLVAVLAGLVLLAGCVSGGGGNANRFATACMAEVKPTGEYLFRYDDDRVLGGKFATLEGIEAMNACISRKAAAAGDAPATPLVGQQVVEVQQSGSQTVETYTYGRPPAAAAAGSAPVETRECRERSVFSGGSGYFGCVR